MAIENLVKMGFLNRLEPATENSAVRSTALMFVIDSSFLLPFKVLLYTIAKNSSGTKLPIIVLTQDEAVLKDEIVKAVADEIRFIGEKEIEQFKVISSRRIPDRYKLDWIPKYTFLKWSMFDDYGVKQVLFIDADILCLNSFEDLLASDAPGDIFGGPRFMEHLILREDKKPHSEGKIFRNLRNMAKGRFDEQHNRLNSGVLLLRERMLNPKFRKELLEFASSREYVNEQSYLTAFFSQSEEYHLSLIASRYNFGAGSLSQLSILPELKILKDIVFLHFPGPRKPWLTEASPTSRFSHVLWHRVCQEAATRTRLLGAEKVDFSSLAADFREADM
ncbi:hypothetical protein EJV46_07790 [Roseococcus sp. SYP-B2431]|uniref:glycosyltransferase n=1 Tax=Roseococcus sp. SYP-B2431 TaxID=2496640 RepID=UPI0010398F82|nr:glycosyltransferase [Roseococcus sp. SYP-B2431]TCI00521.1 hypothetical protein EJV46_07790 [Roseococcus sp. SYP-B2431]